TAHQEQAGCCFTHQPSPTKRHERHDECCERRRLVDTALLVTCPAAQRGPYDRQYAAETGGRTEHAVENADARVPHALQALRLGKFWARQIIETERDQERADRSPDVGRPHEFEDGDAGWDSDRPANDERE